MANVSQTEGRTVDWSFPMNPSHLPPKSPSFPSFGAGPVDSSAAGRTGLPIRSGTHKRTPSAGYLPQAQPTWVDEVVEGSEAGVFKRGAHRRSASESMAFLDGNANFSKMVDENITEEEEFESRSAASIHSNGGSVDFDRLDEDQLMSMFGNDSELYQKQQQEANQKHHVEAMRSNSANNTGGTSASDGWNSDRGRTPPTKPNDPATPSDSNSVSELSNEDLRAGELGKFKSEPEVQSVGDHEGGTQQFTKGELQQALAGLDSSLDPKRAKRILANRQSAQRSRVRKLQYISELEKSVTALQTEVSTMAPQVAFFEHRRAVLNVDNNAIKQKMAALAQGQRFKDAHNDALKKEVQRLRQLMQQQHQMQQQHLQQPGAPKSAYELQQQQFSKLDLGVSIQTDTSVEASDAYTSGLTGAMDSMPTGNGGLSPTHSRTRALPHTLNNMVASTW